MSIDGVVCDYRPVGAGSGVAGVSDILFKILTHRTPLRLVLARKLIETVFSLLV